MTFDEVKKRYERFLKEMGVYKRAIEIHSGRVNGLCKRNIAYPTIIKANTYPRSWIHSSGTFCTWSRTPEKDVFWWAISLLWQYECYENNILLDGYSYVHNIMFLKDDFRRYLEFYNNIGDEKKYSSISINTLEKLKEKIIEVSAIINEKYLENSKNNK
jgi:hypothetical protein